MHIRGPLPPNVIVVVSKYFVFSSSSIHPFRTEFVSVVTPDILVTVSGNRADADRRSLLNALAMYLEFGGRISKKLEYDGRQQSRSFLDHSY